MTTAKNLIRKTLCTRWGQAVLLLTLLASGVYFVWGIMGLIALGGGAVGLGLPLLLGESKHWTAEDQFEHDCRWKWDGSPNDDSLPS